MLVNNLGPDCLTLAKQLWNIYFVDGRSIWWHILCFRTWLCTFFNTYVKVKFHRNSLCVEFSVLSCVFSMYFSSREEFSVDWYIPYFWLLIIICRAIPAQNHLGGSSVPTEQTQGDHAQLSHLRRKYGIVVFLLLKVRETFQMQRRNHDGHIYIQIIKQHIAYCAYF